MASSTLDSSKSVSLRLGREELILLCLMAIIQFSHVVDFMIMMPLGPQLMRNFSISPREFGFLVSSYTFAAGVSGFLTSLFVDRFDRKTCLLFFFLGFTTGTICCGLAQTYEALLATRALTGLFGGVLGSLILSIISDTVTYERRGTAFGILMGSSSMATVFGVPLSLQLANYFGWHAPFICLGLLSMVIIPAIVFLVPSLRNHLAVAKKHTAIASLTHIFKTPNQRMALLFLFCLILGQFSIVPFLSQSFVFNAGLPEFRLPLIYLFGGTCTALIAPISGRLSDRFGKCKVFMVAAVLSLIPITLITNLQPHPTWMLLIISSSFFMIMSGRMVPAMAMISAAATPDYRGSFMSIVSSVQQFSSAIASLAAAHIVTASQGGPLMDYHIVGLIAAVFSMFALLISRKLQSGADTFDQSQSPDL